jgi:hypothetical protein
MFLWDGVIMLISRSITVKSRVTARLRSELGMETQKVLKEIENEIVRVEEALLSLSSRGVDVSSLLESKNSLVARKETLLENLKDIAGLKDGQEVTRGQVEGFYDLKVGDKWPEAMACEIVVEDGRIVAIRENDAISVSLEYGTKPPADSGGLGESREDEH